MGRNKHSASKEEKNCSRRISALIKSGSPDKAEKLIRRAITRWPGNPVFFNQLLQVKENDWSGAYDAFREMKASGTPPDYYTYSVLISILGRAGEVGRAEEIFRDYRASGMTPDEIIYVSMMDAYACGGRSSEVWQTFVLMEESGINISRRAINGVIRAFVVAGDVDLAEQVYNQMEGRGVTPDDVTFSILFNGLSKAGNLDQLENLIERFKASGRKIRKHVYLDIQSAFSRGGRTAPQLDMNAYIIQDEDQSSLLTSDSSFSISMGFSSTPSAPSMLASSR